MTAAAKQYQDFNRRQRWCPAGRTFAAQHQTLGSAWRSCTDGCLMAYWIGIELDTPTTVWRGLVRLKRQVGLDWVLQQGGSTEQRARFATAIRGRFNSDGSIRKRSKG